MARTVNTSHPLYDAIRLIVAVDDDNATIKDFWTPTRVITKDSGVSVKAGNLGYVFELEDAGGGTAPRGIAFGTRPWIENQVGEAMTIVFIFDKWTLGYNGCRYPQWNVTSVQMPYFSGTGTNKATPQIVSNSGTPLLTSTAGFAANTPGMVALSFTRNGTMTLNVNGVTQGSASFPAVDENSITAIRGISGESVVADVFAVCTFDRVLTQAELADLWASCDGGGNIGLLSPLTPPETQLKLARIRLFNADGTPASNKALNWSFFRFAPPNTSAIAGSVTSTDADGWFEPFGAGAAALDVFAIGDNGFLVATDTDLTFTQSPSPVSYAGPCPIIGVDP